MSEFQNISEEEDYYQQLFDMAEKEQKGDLYKKDLYIMKEDLEKIKSKSKLKVMHDNILKKLINEDYRDFIFKTEEKEAKSSDNKEQNKSLNENSINNSKNNNQKEDNGEKEINEEIDYLKELYRLNYLAFSPMATEYFDKISNLSNSSSNKNPKIKPLIITLIFQILTKAIILIYLMKLKKKHQ